MPVSMPINPGHRQTEPLWMRTAFIGTSVGFGPFHRGA